MQNRRAIQFIPFDSLKGFYELLKEVEKDNFSTLEEIINKKIKNLRINDTVNICYYYNDEYVETYGIIKKIDYINKYIILLNSKINFKDIININLINKH